MIINIFTLVSILFIGVACQFHNVLATLNPDPKRPSGNRMKLHACISAYPGTDSKVEGKIVVSFHSKSGWLKYAFKMKNLEKNVAAGTHIHSGTSCDDASLVGGHYWNDMGDPVSYPDPWTPENEAVYRTDKKGRAKGKFYLHTGYKYALNLRHAVVVHAADGSRIGCGILRRAPKC